MTAVAKLEPAGAPAVDPRQFKAEGYFVCRGVLDPSPLGELLAEMDELFAIQLRRLGLPVEPGGTREAFHANAQALLRADIPTYISTARLTQMLPSAHRLMISEPMMAIARALGIETPVISTRVSNHIMSDALRIPGGYHKSPPHQDWRSIQGSLDSIVLWAPLTPVGLRSHPLEVAPRSHLWGLLPTEAHVMTPAVSDPRVPDDAYVGLPMQPGDVAVLSTFTVHRTGEAGDGEVRVAFSSRFNNASEPTYAGHGYPTPYKYSYQTDLIHPGFPTAAELKRVFPAARDD